MFSFTPPTQDAVPPTLPPGDPDQSLTGYKLFRHYRSRPEGRNVFIYSDDSVSEVDPNGVTTQWNKTDGDGTGIYIVACFYGGAGPYAVTSAQATLLTNAGYTVDP